jgi:hypothetical protein
MGRHVNNQAMKSFFVLSFALLLPLVSTAQDSNAVKKPSPQMQEDMPVRKGRGTAKPMPSPRYRQVKPMRKDTIIKGFNKRDTVK